MQLKILITGTYNAGKTQFIQSISEIEPVKTEKRIVSHSGNEKEKTETTVAMDFGRITIDDEIALHLFGTPGQDRFDFMWEILSEGILGYVVLVDSSDSESLEQTRRILKFFECVNAPFVVAANKQDVEGAADLDTIRDKLSLPEDVPLIPCVALERESVKQVLLSLLFKVSDLLEE
ncbi:MAG: ATP/GTP-binding protein [Theionarchaea archaeon]|nr:ATP/GTP-binding protein [Theionarchaea archaeon]MBU7037948.1 ATP/GTP-binding protein [Theionarchaea archaeon]